MTNMVGVMALAVEAEQLVKRFTGRTGTVDAVRALTCTWPRARCSGFWGRTAPASPRPSGC